jgi:hypothetical protein
MAELKPGSRWTSSVCDTEVIVVKGAGEVDLRCGGVAMVAAGDDKLGGGVAAGADGGSARGKRYVDADESVELLCTKAGAGSVGIGDTALELKEAKPLPASD